ncbi:MAG: hypothetical protein GVY06_09150 [Alphaproteobacteria bacterium]|jgi:O-antigen ligase|nr:hypothetical protein [Alphaproteobacteria bacterium]
MLGSIQSTAAAFSALLAGAATGLAWAIAVLSPNCSFDRLDYSRADGHVRQLLRDGSGLISGLLLAAAALGVLGGAYGAGILAVISAGGFFTNRWTLAPRKKSEGAPGLRQRKKSQRIVAVSLSLLFAAVSGIAAVLAVLRI